MKNPENIAATFYIATRGFDDTKTIIKNRRGPLKYLVFNNPFVQLRGTPACTVTGFANGQEALRVTTHLSGHHTFSLVLVKCELSKIGCLRLFGHQSPEPCESYSVEAAKLLMADEREVALTLLSFTGFPVIPASELQLCEESLEALRLVRSDSVQALALSLLEETAFMQKILHKEPDIQDVLKKLMLRLVQMAVDNPAEVEALLSFRRPVPNPEPSGSKSIATSRNPRFHARKRAKRS